jgi:tRNA(fMet)-specific endonuclease VapC
MKGFDTDVLTLLLRGDPHYLQKAAKIPIAEQGVPIVAAEEVLRGRLDAIRHAQAGKSKLTVDESYRRLERTIVDLQHLELLSYTQQAESLFQYWRKQRIRVGSSDLRIAAICVAQSATLVSRNRRDFSQVPGLSVEYW